MKITAKVYLGHEKLVDCEIFSCYVKFNKFYFCVLLGNGGFDHVLNKQLTDVRINGVCLKDYKVEGVENGNEKD